MANYDDGFNSDPNQPLTPKQWAAWVLMGDPHGRIPAHSVMPNIAERITKAITRALIAGKSSWKQAERPSKFSNVVISKPGSQRKIMI